MTQTVAVFKRRVVTAPQQREATMSITFHKHANNFTVISNTCINDPRLGFEALAIFLHLRSKPANWVVRPKEIAARFKAGRDRIRNALNELVECGYVGKVQTRDSETGRLGPVDYVVRALPEDMPDAPAEVAFAAAPPPEIPSTVPPPSTETPSTGTPSTVIRSLLSTDLLPNTDSTKEERTLAFARARSEPSDEEIDQAFDEGFWPAYPERGGDQGELEAKKRFRKIVKSSAEPQATVDKIIDAAKQYAEHWAPKIERDRSEAKFIPMAEKWLSKGRWEGSGPKVAEKETMFDLARHFEQRARDLEHHDHHHAHA
jgi:hypothetical protein